MIRFACPHCRTVLELAEEHAGALVACGACAEVVQVPVAQAQLIALPDVLADEPPAHVAATGIVAALITLALVVAVFALALAEDGGSDGYFGAAAAFIALGAVLFLVWLGHDIRSRAPDQAALWALVILVGNVFGVLAWLVLRPPLRRGL